jgi:hypothetical protein
MSSSETNPDEPEKKPRERETKHDVLRMLMNPIVVIAISIQFAVFVLIGSAIFGFDRGHVLTTMSQISFARGLITYLFTTVTVSTAVVLIVSALTTGGDEVHDKQYQRGKEVLSLLLGVFGTIVGFYFGSEVGAKNERPLEIAPLRLGKTEVLAGEQFTLMTIVGGGRGPYRFGISVGDGLPQATETTDGAGWITKDVAAPQVSGDETLTVRVVAKDVDDHGAERTDRIVVRPKHH